MEERYKSGCKARDTLNLIQPDDITISGLVTEVLCFGDASGAINSTLNGGTLPYTILWSNNSSLEDLSGLNSGTYTIDVTDLNGCNNQHSFTVNQPNASLSISATTNAILCNGDQTAFIDLDVNGGVEPYSFSWSNAAISEDLQNLGAGSYTVTVIDVNNCQEQFTQNISEPSAIVGTFSNINPVCQAGSQGSIDLNVTGGTLPYNYLWNSLETTEDISGLFAGNYVCTLTDANNCVTQLQTSLSDPDALVITSSIVDDPCYNGGNGMIDITVSNGSAPFSFDWSNNTSNQDATGLLAGVYFVNVTDANSCGVFQSFVVNQPDTLLYFTLTNASTLLCFGDNNASIDIEVDGGTSPYSYSWSTSANTEDINSLSAGTYTVTVSDNNDCELIQNISISEPNAIQLTENHIDVLCKGASTGSIDLSSAGGSSPYSYNWNNGATSEDISNLLAGTYSVSVTDLNACASSISIVIDEPATVISITSLTSPVLCFGAVTGSIDLTITGGSPAYTVQWDTGQNMEDITNISAGTYIATATDANGCSETHTAQINPPTSNI